jgi:hypothetical protein
MAFGPGLVVETMLFTAALKRYRVTTAVVADQTMSKKK